MKLAEALVLRADLQKRIEQIHSRLRLNAKIQEGEKPAENPTNLLKELEASFVQLQDLITRINQTNSEFVDKDKRTLTAMISERDCLRQKTGILRDFLAEASDVISRGMRTEIKIKSTVSVAEMQKTVDALSKQLRELDTYIQSLNWTIDLI